MFKTPSCQVGFFVYICIMSMFILQCLFVTFFVRFWNYFKSKVVFVDFRTELIGLFGDFTAAFILLGVIDLILWLIM
jgi:hypothetical protein